MDFRMVVFIVDHAKLENIIAEETKNHKQVARSVSGNIWFHYKINQWSFSCFLIRYGCFQK